MRARASADLAIFGADIRTLDRSRPRAHALAVRGGRIVAIGDDAEVRVECDAATEQIDGRGLTLTPGLVDTHIHPFRSDWTAGVHLAGLTELPGVEATLAAERARIGDSAWVLGWGLEYGAFNGARLDGRLLDRAVSGAPTLLIFLDGHTGLATPRALELAGVEGPVPLDGSAQVVVRGGVPTGELREPAALELVRRAIPPLEPREERELFSQTQRGFSEVGLTGAHVMDGTAATLDLLRKLEAEDRLAVRVLRAFTQHPNTSFEAMAQDAELGGVHGRLWRTGVAKFFIDGVLDTGTSWLEEPDLKGDGLRQLWPDPSRYERAVKFFAAAGFQCVTHATGDRAARAALDAYRDLDHTKNVTHRIEHVELLRDRELPRFAAEGVAASMQPVHMQWLRADLGDSISSRLGAKHLAQAWRIGDLVRGGALVPLGSDWPVATYDPRVGMAWARLRRVPANADGYVFAPGQAIDGLQALHGYTTAAARVAGEQDVAGRVALGFRADLTGFAADPVTCPADELSDVPIRLTVVDGRIRHRD